MKSNSRYVLREAFARAWSLRLSPDIDEYTLSREHSEIRASIGVVSDIDLEWRILGDESPAIIHVYLREFDTCFSHEQQLSLARAEFQYRWRDGRRIDRNHYLKTLPSAIAAELSNISPNGLCPAEKCDSEFVALTTDADDTAECPECHGRFPADAVFKYVELRWCESDAPEWLRREIAHGNIVGHGGFGVVHRVRDQEVCNRPLAVKVMKGQTDDSVKSKMFQQEIEILASLEHPGVPPIHRRGILPNGCPYFAMRLFEGDTLARLLAELRTNENDERDRKQSTDNAIRAIEVVAQVLAFAHSRSRPVVHRDVKPANIFVGDCGDKGFGEIFLLDWGIAVFADSAQVALHAASVPYMSPEQAVGAVSTPGSDVFSLASVLYEVLTNQTPWEGSDDSVLSLRELARKGDIQAATERLRGLKQVSNSSDSIRTNARYFDKELIEICEKAITVDPKVRFPSGVELSKAFSSWRDSQSLRAKEAFANEIKRRRTQIVALLSTLLFVLSLQLPASYSCDNPTTTFAFPCKKRIVVVMLSMRYQGWNWIKELRCMIRNTSMKVSIGL